MSYIPIYLSFFNDISFIIPPHDNGYYTYLDVKYVNCYLAILYLNVSFPIQSVISTLWTNFFHSTPCRIYYIINTLPTYRYIVGV